MQSAAGLGVRAVAACAGFRGGGAGDVSSFAAARGVCHGAPSIAGEGGVGGVAEEEREAAVTEQ